MLAGVAMIHSGTQMFLLKPAGGAVKLETNKAAIFHLRPTENANAMPFVGAVLEYLFFYEDC